MIVRALAVPLGFLVVLSGCMGGGQGCMGRQDFSGQGAVCNEENSFHYGLQGTASKTETYTWQNSKSKATVAMGFQGTGSVSVTLKDASGTSVFTKTYQGAGQAGGTETTRSGAPGAWTIQIQMRDLQGQMGVTVGAV
jgi:hypothetical protein